MNCYSLVDLAAGKSLPDGPFRLDVIMYDVPETIIAAVRSLPERCISVRLGDHPSRSKVAIQIECDAAGLLVDWVPCERLMLSP